MGRMSLRPGEKVMPYQYQEETIEKLLKDHPS
jgi:hypothetical protein